MTRGFRVEGVTEASLTSDCLHVAALGLAGLSPSALSEGVRKLRAWRGAEVGQGGGGGEGGEGEWGDSGSPEPCIPHKPEEITVELLARLSRRRRYSACSTFRREECGLGFRV